MLSCEMCGASLQVNGHYASHHHLYEEMPNRRLPISVVNGSSIPGESDLDSLKFSFRTGGEKIFYEKLNGALVQRKWLLQSAPSIPDPISYTEIQDATTEVTSSFNPRQPSKFAGIAGLERRGLDIRKKNEAMIGSAFEDLEGLMASAKEIIALAETFAKSNDNASDSDASQLIAESAKGLDMVTTKDMLDKGPKSESLYLTELSRNLAEYLNDDAKGVLKREGGIMTLVDLWAVFNRARGGVELISPSDFEKAARLWEKLKLPVRVRQLKNGLLIVQQADRTDDNTIAQLLNWLQMLHTPVTHPQITEATDLEPFGSGVTAQDTAQHFGWSLGVASEELEMAEEKGALCRESGAVGTRYWENWLVDYRDDDAEDDIVVNGQELLERNTDEILQGLRDTGLL